MAGIARCLQDAEVVNWLRGRGSDEGRGVEEQRELEALAVVELRKFAPVGMRCAAAQEGLGTGCTADVDSSGRPHALARGTRNPDALPSAETRLDRHDAPQRENQDTSEGASIAVMPGSEALPKGTCCSEPNQGTVLTTRLWRGQQNTAALFCGADASVFVADAVLANRWAVGHVVRPRLDAFVNAIGVEERTLNAIASMAICWHRFAVDLHTSEEFEFIRLKRGVWNRNENDTLRVTDVPDAAFIVSSHEYYGKVLMKSEFHFVLPQHGSDELPGSQRLAWTTYTNRSSCGFCNGMSMPFCICPQTFRNRQSQAEHATERQDGASRYAALIAQLSSSCEGRTLSELLSSNHRHLFCEVRNEVCRTASVIPSGSLRVAEVASGRTADKLPLFSSCADARRVLSSSAMVSLCRARVLFSDLNPASEEAIVIRRLALKLVPRSADMETQCARRPSETLMLPKRRCDIPARLSNTSSSCDARQAQGCTKRQCVSGNETGMGANAVVPDDIEGEKDPGLVQVEVKSVVGTEKLCSLCTKKFASDASLRRHSAMVHEKERAGGFACAYCEMSFHYAYLLRNHVATVHDRKRSYPCGECDATFTTSSNLRRHHRECHELQRPYSCGLCGMDFAKHSNFTRHLNSTGHLMQINSSK